MVGDEIAIGHSAPSGVEGRHWGDTHFADSLVDALGRAGSPARSVAYDDTDTIGPSPIIYIRGLYPHLPASGARSVLWVISHSDRVTDEELAAYDHVCVASTPEAAALRGRTRTPVHVLHQATDTTRFRPPGTRPVVAGNGVVVVANYRWPGRRAPRWLRMLGVDFQLYGAHWEDTPEERYVVATRVPNADLGGLYATADIVVADQWTQMAASGFVANRLFDVLAAGGFVLSDAGPGVTEVFDGHLPTYDTREDLGEQVQRWLVDHRRRRALAERLRDLTVSRHTFDHRARTLLELLRD